MARVSSRINSRGAEPRILGSELENLARACGVVGSRVQDPAPETPHQCVSGVCGRAMGGWGFISTVTWVQLWPQRGRGLRQRWMGGGHNGRGAWVTRTEIAGHGHDVTPLVPGKPCKLAEMSR